MLETNERLYQWLLKKSSGSQTGKIRADRALNGLAGDLGLDPISVRRGLYSLRQDGRVEYTSTPAGEPVSPFITVIKPLMVEPAHAIRWRGVLEAAACKLPDGDKVALSDLGEALDGFSRGDMEILLDGLLRLREDQEKLAGQPAYLVSARYLLGSSKLFGQLASRAIKAFGIDSDRFAGHPPYVVVGGCANPHAVILVENPACFELAMSTQAAKRCAFMATYGFGLSKTSSEYGNQLAGLVESHLHGAVGLVREGSTCPSAAFLLAHDRVTFWGDLDLAGMQIYQRLRRRLPQLKLSSLYVPMIRALRGSGNHPYTEATGKQGQRPQALDDPIAAGLAELCMERGVDQEWVTPEEIDKYAGDVLQTL
jgi:hypothetical protein